jgi:hypothetical protein
MKASPYHNPNIRNDVAKILSTKDGLDDEYYHDELDLPKRDIVPPAPKTPFGGGAPDAPKPVDGSPQGGRPANQKDKVKRKTKNVAPTSSAAVLWAYNAQKAIADEITPMILDFYDKKNVRSLTKAEFDQLEYFKLCLLTNIEPFIELNPEIIKQLIDNSGKPSVDFLNEINSETDSFVYANKRKPNTDEMKYIYASIYVKLLEVEV